VFASGVLVGIALRARLAGGAASPTRAVSQNAAHRGSVASVRRIGGPAYPAEVLNVLDGDTFVARVKLWPGLETTTKVRLRGIDAPEMHARCERERTLAVAARDKLAALLADGAVGIAHVARDKYGGRVLAAVATRRTADVSAALLAAGAARPYGGKRRESWCAGASSSSQRVTTTGVPTPTRSKRSRMSALYMRIQPYETKPPTEPGTLVPWIA
jgi:endonuclease YncB( thermonuclease family)